MAIPELIKRNRRIVRNLVIMLVIVPAAMGAQAFAQVPPATPTEIDINLLNPDGSNINTSLLLVIDYYDSDLNLQSIDSVNNAGTGSGGTVFWGIYNGKSNLFNVLSANGGTNINITVAGYGMLVLTAVEGGYIVGDYYLSNVTQIFPDDTPPSNVPEFPTELDLNLLNTDGSNIDTNLPLVIDYYDTNLNLLSINPVDNSNRILWSIYNGKSNVYALVPAKDGTDIVVTVDRYESVTVTAVEGGYVSGTYYLNNVTQIPPTTTTTTVSTTTTTSTTTTSTTTTTTTVPDTTTTTVPPTTTTTTTVPTTTTTTTLPPPGGNIGNGGNTGNDGNVGNGGNVGNVDGNYGNVGNGGNVGNIDGNYDVPGNYDLPPGNYDGNIGNVDGNVGNVDGNYDVPGNYDNIGNVDGNYDSGNYGNVGNWGNVGNVDGSTDVSIATTSTDPVSRLLQWLSGSGR